MWEQDKNLEWNDSYKSSPTHPLVLQSAYFPLLKKGECTGTNKTTPATIYVVNVRTSEWLAHLDDYQTTTNHSTTHVGCIARRPIFYYQIRTFHILWINSPGLGKMYLHFEHKRVHAYMYTVGKIPTYSARSILQNAVGLTHREFQQLMGEKGGEKLFRLTCP